MNRLGLWILASTLGISSGLNIPETNAMNEVKEQVVIFTSPEWENLSAENISSVLIPVNTSMFLWHTTKTSPPFWYLSFCSREKISPICQNSYELWDSFVDLDKAFEKIEKIHTFVNTQVLPTSDKAKYGKDEYWETITGKKDWRWDCDKYVLAKIEILLEEGIPHRALRPTVVILYNKEIKKYEAHLILIIFTDKWVLILDNLQKDIFIAGKLEDILADRKLGYSKIVQMPSDENPQIWVKPKPLG